MSAIDDCKYEIQSIVDAMSNDVKVSIEHGFEKMQKNPHFEKMIIDVAEKIKRENPPQFVASQEGFHYWSYQAYNLSVFGLKSGEYGLPDSFNNSLDFMTFAYGLAKMFSIDMVSVTYVCEDSNECEKEYTEKFSALSDFLEWIKNQFEFSYIIYTIGTRVEEKERSMPFGLNGPTSRSVGGFSSKRNIIRTVETKRHHSLFSSAFGKIDLSVWSKKPHTITFYRVPPIKRKVKAQPVSWY